MQLAMRHLEAWKLSEAEQLALVEAALALAADARAVVRACAFQLLTQLAGASARSAADAVDGAAKAGCVDRRRLVRRCAAVCRNTWLCELG